MNPEIQLPRAVQRLRLTFSKGGQTRFISHLDLARALERSLNRAGLPVAYTQGFNRRPRLSLASALPLGYTSEGELADVWLTEAVPPESFLERLNIAIAPGIFVSSVREVPLSEPALQAQMVESLYYVRFSVAVDWQKMEADIGAMLASESVMAERYRSRGAKTQTINLRPLVLEMWVEGDGACGRRLAMRLVQTATQTGRPDDVLAALGLDPLDAVVHRVALRLAGPDSPIQ